MEYLVYLFYRAFTLAVSSLPLRLAFRLGQALGTLGYFLFAPYRRLAIANLRVAYGEKLTPAEIRRLARQHFAMLSANVLASIKMTNFDAAQLREIVEVEGQDIMQRAFDERRGIVLAISHLGSWELFAQVCQFMPAEKWGTIYQSLGNHYIDDHVQRTRQKVTLFARKRGFNAPADFLREGGAVGVMIDQHSGDGGLWMPFFGRLASTSALAALLAQRANAVVVPMAVRTIGVARWRVEISAPVDSSDGSTEDLTSRLNRLLEAQINLSPADWFWVHNRWKTPKPKFLLADYKRGFYLPPDVAPADLKPFRILVRSTNWLGDAVMTIPAVQAIAQGRPDARVIILAPAKLADLWRVVPGVAEVVEIPEGGGLVAAVRAIKKAAPLDVAILLPNSLRAALEVFLAGVPRRVGFPGHRRTWLLNQIVPLEPKPPKDSPPVPVAVTAQVRVNQSRQYARLAMEIGANAAEMFGVPPPARDSRTAQNGWRRIGICPGAEYGPTKRWPAERFAETARLVSAEKSVQWVIFGVAKDAPFGDTVAKALEGNCENLVGKTNLGELIEQLRTCDMLLTNDTGTMHLAAYLGVPVAAIFGSTDPVLTGPLAPPERVRILRRQVECNPCFLKNCPLDLRCLQAVTAADAAATTLELVATEAD